MLMKAELFALLAAALFLAPADAAARTQKPSPQSLVEAWEQLQRSDPETLAFEKIGERRYRFKTNRFPFDGELKILKATVDDSTADFEYGHIRGVIEYDLAGLAEEVVKKYEHSYESWRENNSLYFDGESSSWMSPAQHRVKQLAKAKETTRYYEAENAGREKAKNASAWVSLALYWLPVLILLVFWAWFMKKTGIRRQREYMNAATTHMQNVEALLERIAAAVEADRKPQG